MRITKIKNVSSEDVLVRTNERVSISLPPGVEHKGLINATNLDELKGKVSFIADLREIPQNSGKAPLFD